MLLLDRLLDAAGHRLHVAAGHPAVGVEPLVDDRHVGRLVEEIAVVEGEPAADVDEGVLLAAHGAAVGERTELPQDLGHARVRVAGLAHLDEVGVLHRAGRVEDDAEPLRVRVGAHGSHVLHGDRLAAGHVDGGGDRDVGDPLGTDPVDQHRQLAEVDVPLEGVLRLGVVRLVDDDVVEGAARQFLVETGGGEVHVAGDVVARLDQEPADEVLGAATLVRRHHVTVTVVLAHRVEQVVEVAAAGIGLVAEHHAGPLVVAHGRGARVGEEVDVDVLAAEQEGVVARLGRGRHPLATGQHLDRLHDLDAEWLGPRAMARLAAGPLGRLELGDRRRGAGLLQALGEAAHELDAGGRGGRGGPFGRRRSPRRGGLRGIGSGHGSGSSMRSGLAARWAAGQG